jgi:hypothetical protein
VLIKFQLGFELVSKTFEVENRLLTAELDLVGGQMDG